MDSTTLLPKTWQVPQIILTRLGDRPGRQRAMLEEGHLLLVLHGPPKPDEDLREGRYFWREPDGNWHTTLAGSGLAAMQEHIGEFSKLVDAQEKAEEVADIAEDYFKVLRDLTPLKRTIQHLHSTLQHARELVRSDRMLITCRDDAYVLDREAELLHADTKNSLDYYIARQSEAQARQGHEMAQSAHRLNILAAIFLPLATLASLLGMNIPHGLEESKAPGVFLIVLAVGLVLGLLLTALFFGKRRSTR